MSLVSVSWVSLVSVSWVDVLVVCVFSCVSVLLICLLFASSVAVEMGCSSLRPKPSTAYTDETAAVCDPDPPRSSGWSDLGGAEPRGRVSEGSRQEGRHREAHVHVSKPRVRETCENVVRLTSSQL